MLDHLVQRREVATNSHLRALNALLFLFQHVMRPEAGGAAAAGAPARARWRRSVPR